MMTPNSDYADKSPDKKTLSTVQLLHPYVKQRIRVAENLGIFPRNMYKSNEIIDEVVLKVYEEDLHKSLNQDDLRIAMFKLTFDRMNELLASEEWHKDAISTKLILEDELKQLEENFTMDADNDLIMNEDLDDISYHLNDKEGASLPYDEQEEGVKVLLGIDRAENAALWDDRKQIRKLYYKLPLNTSNIVDLYILGKLSFAEIASILKTEMAEVKEIVNFVKDKFRKQME
jgi:DNA-directed RNA polymerase specialized sigma24 family protein